MPATCPHVEKMVAALLGLPPDVQARVMLEALVLAWTERPDLPREVFRPWAVGLMYEVRMRLNELEQATPTWH